MTFWPHLYRSQGGRRTQRRRPRSARYPTALRSNRRVRAVSPRLRPQVHASRSAADVSSNTSSGWPWIGVQPRGGGGPAVDLLLHPRFRFGPAVDLLLHPRFRLLELYPAVSVEASPSLARSARPLAHRTWKREGERGRCRVSSWGCRCRRCPWPRRCPIGTSSTPKPTGWLGRRRDRSSTTSG